MKRESYTIKKFNGIVSNVNPSALNVDFAIDSNNVDGDAPEGLLRFVRGNSTISSTYGIDYKRGTLLKLNDETYSLIYVNHNNVIKAINNFYGSKIDSGINESANAYAFVQDREAVYIATDGTPKWIGKIRYNLFDVTPPSNLYVSNATLDKPSNNSGSFYISSVNKHETTGESVFELNTKLSYRISIEYDYVNETILSDEVTVNITSAVDKVTVNIVCVDGMVSGAVNKRITAVKLYRKDIAINSATPQATLYKLIKRFPTESTTYSDFQWTESGNNFITSFDDTNETDYGSYESQTGISEVAESVDMKYKLACAINNRLYVGYCTKNGVSNASTMIFRSKEFRYSMFDWATLGEFIKLPSVPTAMISYNGKLWVFDYNHIYKINPEAMQIEDVTEGIGCLGQESIVVTDYGIYWCDSKNAYWYDGAKIVSIGDLIKQSIGEWHGFVYDYGLVWQEKVPYVKFISQINSIIFCVIEPETGECNAWIWNIKKERWDKREDIAAIGTNAGGLFTGDYGEAYLATGSVLVKLYFSSTLSSGYWKSGVFDGGDISQEKKFYLIKYNGNAIVQYSIDGGSYQNLVNTYEMKDANGKWQRGKYIQLYISSSGGNVQVKDVTIIYRTLEGKR